jgi:hypothetical protein
MEDPFDMRSYDQQENISIFRSAVVAGILVGTLDIVAALILTTMRGGNPVKLFQFIASGLFGMPAFAGGWRYAVYGLTLHYVIAMAWTLLFFYMGRKFRRIYHHKVLSGILYGMIIWIIMNLVVLPLSATPPIPFNYTAALTGILVLIAAIGLPLAFVSAKHFTR